MCYMMIHPQAVNGASTDELQVPPSTMAAKRAAQAKANAPRKPKPVTPPEPKKPAGNGTKPANGTVTEVIRAVKDENTAAKMVCFVQNLLPAP